MQDLSKIKKELIGFKEIDHSYLLNRNCYIKYITLKDNNEFFYNGGYFLNYSFNKIILINNNKKIFITLSHKDKNGNILYKSRLFLKIDENKLTKKNKEDYEKIIQNQQIIIKKLTSILKKNNINI